ncbi:uncharacterized protein LY89DRAFT_739817 [Mollisia scopiformis]|uniref:HMG box domain-containing protein n=1 Tax=Mollisia scopiformis TaxID=149040 RepID=A0A194WS81_MOLSC|nr:uncharacterized protein LY89DRAFT_739817 [Mollisia scopiformis]KUJ10831.1 hypothetical protein LY89DRAFT_739817 [Mollisia scopiformis]
MLELQATLEDLGLQEYLSRLVEHGFDTWDSLAGITETDMAALGIKLGHRRRLQRENARRLGYPANEPLFDLPAAAPQMMGQYNREDGIRSCGGPPLRDPHVLPRPDTGYAAYARLLRHDPKISSLSLIELARLVRNRWSNLSGELKDMWNEIAAVQKDTHNSPPAQHRQPEECWVCSGCSNSGKLGEDQREAQVKCNNAFPETSRIGLPWSIANTQAAENSTYSFEFTNQPPELAQGSPTASASTIYTPHETEVLLSRYKGYPTTSVYGSVKADVDMPLIESVWKIILRDQALYSAVLPIQLNQDNLSSCTCRRPAFSQSLHVKTINPFDLQQRSMLQLMIDSFLRNVNSVYYLVNPDELWNHLDSALNMTLGTPNLVTSIVCVCLALGCQSYHADATDMAIMWYENGRRYLDDRDWCLDVAVMQVLALISIFHMAQRPATSSHYLDAASDYILLLGCGTDGSILRISQTSPQSPATPRHDTRAQSTVATIAFGELSDTLGCVQQQFGQSNTLPLWRGILFIQKLKSWLYNLPDELALPIVHGLERWDLGLIKHVFSKASDTRKVELLHIYSLYFGVIGLLTGPSLQQIAAADTKQPLSAMLEAESNAYECLNSALRLIDLCTAFSCVSLFPTYAWLPQCVLFTSSLACTLGIIWQRQVLDRDASASQEWLNRSYSSIHDALVILGPCATRNEQAQRHYRVLQQIVEWLQATHVTYVDPHPYRPATHVIH